MIDIYIARHGETLWNLEGRLQGQNDTALSAKGRAQGLALREKVGMRPLAAVYASTLQRSIQTAQPVADLLGLAVRQQPEMNEIALGILEGKTIAEVRATMPAELERFQKNRFTCRFPGAENYADVAARARPFAEMILRLHEGQEILVVGHMCVNKMLIATLLGVPLEDAVKIRQANDSIYLIRRDREARLFCWKDGQCLEAPPEEEEPLL